MVGALIMSEPSSKMGRPTIELDLEMVAKLCQRNLTAVDIGYILNVSTDTIDRRIKEKTGLTFSQFKRQNLAKTKLSLTDKAFSMVFSDKPSVPMLMFLLREFFGIGKGGDININTQVNHVTVPNEEIKDRLKQLADKYANEDEIIDVVNGENSDEESLKREGE